MKHWTDDMTLNEAIEHVSNGTHPRKKPTPRSRFHGMTGPEISRIKNAEAIEAGRQRLQEKRELEERIATLPPRNPCARCATRPEFHNSLGCSMYVEAVLPRSYS